MNNVIEFPKRMEDDVFVKIMNSAQTPEEEKGFAIIVERMLCLRKYKNLINIYGIERGK